MSLFCFILSGVGNSITCFLLESSIDVVINSPVNNARDGSANVSAASNPYTRDAMLRQDAVLRQGRITATPVRERHWKHSWRLATRDGAGASRITGHHGDPSHRT